MNPWKAFRDCIVICACLYGVWHISTLHKSEGELKIERAKAIINQRLGIQ